MNKLISFFAIFLFIFCEEKVKPIILNKKLDFISITKPNKEIETILRNSCYDCHSLETKYPSYANYFPISLIINRHINTGREYINFSEWANYNADSKKTIIENSINQIEINKMPMASYKLLHQEANLNKKQKEALINWFRLEKY
ncbi:MAG: heme-binding domain-containing protein [Solirubrobacteraceae bacterium]